MLYIVLLAAGVFDLCCVPLGEVYSCKVNTPSHDGDWPNGATQRVVHHSGGITQDFITPTKLVSSTSWRPLHDLCMCTEAVSIGQIIYCLKQQRAAIFEFKTDGILYQPRKKEDTHSAISEIS